MNAIDDARAAVAATCRAMSASGLVVGTAGNVSARVGDEVVVSPSGLEYARLTPDLVGVHRMDGTAVDAPLAPSSELPLHLAVYAATDAAAIVHTHASASTALSAVLDELPASHYYVALFGGPVRVAPYATFGSDELAASVVAALRDRSAALMGNHGAVVTGSGPAKALELAGYLEYVCDQHLRALSTGLAVRELSAAQVGAVVGQLAGYGQQPPR
ncbi:class II aldolase/adducin family protein [Pseudonocardia humida]|uniref:Class II aldolase/adducin family protein n=1 Tax=Pseudonocardia humida TaxID=2800819 RepID=A0ABT1A2P1_9PSEU|nr:class II aldolase/adducin family protein [Pseudonocardia humida]MCO1657185.1 class II aldolase/adducin family protein [Pseudonocardia humida]